MNCETCSATMVPVYGQSHCHCQTCNVFHFPTDLEAAEDGLQPTGNMTKFQCCKCSQPLELGKLRGMLDVCFCQSCRGYVIDSESLGEVIQQLRGSYEGEDDKPQPINPDDLDAGHPCPACLEPMDAHPYYGPGNVVIDTCRNCKLGWLDHGELATIVRAPGVRPDRPKTGNYESAVLRQAIQQQADSSQVDGISLLFLNL